MEATVSRVFDTLTDQEIDAMVEVMLLAACADGAPVNAEMAALKKSLQRVDEFWLKHVDLDQRMANARIRLDSESREDRLLKLRTMLPWPEQRLLALKLAIRISVADGQLQPVERAVILQTAEALGVGAELAAELVGKGATLPG
jgi:uncharacterized tellurite resistance protein B-like protein